MKGDGLWYNLTTFIEERKKCWNASDLARIIQDVFKRNQDVVVVWFSQPSLGKGGSVGDAPHPARTI